MLVNTGTAPSTVSYRNRPIKRKVKIIHKFQACGLNICMYR